MSIEKQVKSANFITSVVCCEARPWFCFLCDDTSFQLIINPLISSFSNQQIKHEYLFGFFLLSHLNLSAWMAYRLSSESHLMKKSPSFAMAISLEWLWLLWCVISIFKVVLRHLIMHLCDTHHTKGVAVKHKLVFVEEK